MFSLQKNFIKEQQKLVNDIQDQLIEANVEKNNLEELLHSHERFMGYFKKVAQILPYYNHEQNEVSNIILDIIDAYNLDQCDEEQFQKIEDQIKNWESSLIAKNEQIENKDEQTPELKKEEPVQQNEEKNSSDNKVIESFGGIVLVDEE